jgi:hypothetical protein
MGNLRVNGGILKSITAALLVLLLITSPYTVVELKGTHRDAGPPLEDVGLGWPPEIWGVQGPGSYLEAGGESLPLGTFNYPPEIRWDINLSYDEDTLTDPLEGLTYGDFNGDGSVDVVRWGQHELVLHNGANGKVRTQSDLVPSDLVELDEEGHLYLAHGFARAEDLDGDETDELLLVGEPTGSGALPGFQLWLVDIVKDTIVWKATLGGNAPEGMLLEDLDGDGVREVLYLVRGRNRDDYTCLDSSNGRVLWRASHYLDWDNIPMAFIENATGDGKDMVYLGARYRWRSGGALGDIEVRLLDVGNQTFHDVLIPYGGSEPKALVLAQAKGDRRPEVVAFLDSQVRIFDLVTKSSAGAIQLGDTFKETVRSWVVGDLDRDGAEEIAFSEIGPLPDSDDGDRWYVLKTGILYPSKGRFRFIAEPEELPRAQKRPIGGQVQLFRGIPWGGMIALAEGAVEAFEGRDVKRIWGIDLNDWTQISPERTGLHIADLDGDGEMEFIAIMVEEGKGARLGMFEPGEPRVKVLSATREGRTCYAQYRDYDFSFDIVPRGGTGTILAYQFLVPVDPTPLASWGVKGGFSNPKGEWVSLGENSRYFGLPGGGSRVTFSLNFTWDCPLEDFQDVILRITFEGDEEEDHPFGNIFRVENDLRLQGELHAEGSNGRHIEPGGWVGSDETIRIRGVTVAYEGAPDLHPPFMGGVVNWTEAGQEFNKSMVFDRGAEGVVELDTVEGVTEGSMDFYLTVDTESDSSDIIVERLILRIDGMAPDVLDVLPDNIGTFATTRVTVGFTLHDDWSCPDPERMEYSVRKQGETRFSDWISPNDITALADGKNVTYYLRLDLPDNGEHTVRFRGWDIATNGPVVTPPVAVRIDTNLMMFLGASPSGWASEDPVQAGIRVVSRGGTMVNASTISYRSGTAGPFSMGDWQTAGLEGLGASYEVVADLALPTGTENFVQWRAKGTGDSRTWISEPYRIKVDRKGPEFGPWGPDPEQVLITKTTEFFLMVYDNSSGINGSSVEVAAWNGTGAPTFVRVPSLPSSSKVEVRKVVDLVDGRENFVQVRCYDAVGNGPVLSPVYSLWADLATIAFNDFLPLPGAPVDGPLVNASLNVSDGGGSGVDLASLEYAVWLAGGDGWGPWNPIGLWGVAQRYPIVIELNLSAGTENLVRFRGNDIVETQEVWSEEFMIWVNGPPIAVFERPSTGLMEEGKTQTFEVSYFDPENDTVEITWWLNDEEFLGTGPTLELKLKAGDYEVSARFDDGHGHNTTLTMVLKVSGEDDVAVVGLMHWVATANATPLAFAGGWLFEDRKIKRANGKRSNKD